MRYALDMKDSTDSFAFDAEVAAVFHLLYQTHLLLLAVIRITSGKMTYLLYLR